LIRIYEQTHTIEDYFKAQKPKPDNRFFLHTALAILQK